MNSIRIVAGLLLTMVCFIGSSAFCLASETLTLEDAWRVIKTKRFVDLTHAFSPGVPHWKGFPDERRETLYWYEPGVGKLGSGFYAQCFIHVGQWGTHVDPPAHFAKGLRTVDQIDVKEMLLSRQLCKFFQLR